MIDRRSRGQLEYLFPWKLRVASEVVSLSLVVCLLTLAVYCVILAVINHRRHPLVVAGTWDFVGILFAASGFLLIGGPMLLTVLDERWRQFWLVGPSGLPSLSGGGWLFWIAVWMGYFVTVVIAAAWCLRRRRGLTAIYNIEPEALDEILPQVLDELGLRWSRQGNRVRIGHARSTDADAPMEKVALLDVDPFPLMRNVTLHWERNDEALRLQIETLLAKVLAELHTRHNPVAGWLLSVAAVLFFLMLVGPLVVLAWMYYLHR